jgi:hypothetical protein
MMDLTAMEELAYRRVLDLIFKTDDHLRDDDRVMPTATKTGRQWSVIKASLVAKGKIEIGGGLIRNARATETCTETREFRAQKRAAVTARHERGKALKNQEVASTCEGTYELTTVPTRQQRTIEESDSLRESGAVEPHRAAPKPVVSVFPAESADIEFVPANVTAPETDAERIRRQLWVEGNAIVRRLMPDISEAEMRGLIGWGAKLLGDGARMVQTLRDVEVEFATAKAAGDPIRRIRGFIHNRAGTSRVAKASAAAAPVSTAAHAERRIRELDAIMEAS